MNLYGDIVHDNSPKPKPKFAVGDKICITVKKDVFCKGYLPCWTEELFTISAIQHVDPLTYKIKDLNGEEIKGTSYEQEMQKSTTQLGKKHRLPERPKPISAGHPLYIFIYTDKYIKTKKN
jgi:hypothetical protein